MINHIKCIVIYSILFCGSLVALSADNMRETLYNIHPNEIFRYNPIISNNGNTAFYTLKYSYFTYDKDSRPYIQCVVVRVIKVDLITMTSKAVYTFSDFTGVENPGSVIYKTGTCSDDGRYFTFVSVIPEMNNKRCVMLLDTLTDELQIVNKNLQGEILPFVPANPIMLSRESGVCYDINGWESNPRKYHTGILFNSLGGVCTEMDDTFLLAPSTGRKTMLVGRQQVPKETPDNAIGIDYELYIFALKEKNTTQVYLPKYNNDCGDTIYHYAISDDGKYIAYSTSYTNHQHQIFLYERGTNTTRIVSTSNDGIIGNGNSDTLFMSGNGQYILYRTEASNIAGIDRNKDADLILYDVVNKISSRISVDENGKEFNSGISHFVMGGTNNDIKIMFVLDNIIYYQDAVNKFPRKLPLNDLAEIIGVNQSLRAQ